MNECSLMFDDLVIGGSIQRLTDILQKASYYRMEKTDLI